MKKLIQTIISLLLILASFQCVADKEPWYFKFGFGGAVISNPSQYDNYLTQLEAQPGADRSTHSLDIAIYYPNVNEPNVGFGIAFTSSGDMVTRDAVEDFITTETYGGSYIKFFGPEIGIGFNYRVDAGLAARRYTFSDKTSEYYSETTRKWGAGVLVGIGYGFGITSGTRLVFDLNATSRNIESETFNAIQLGLGFIF